MSRTNFRPAVAMIELIFAMVIIGIVLMSAPMLISTAVSSTSVVLQQEGINEAASMVNTIMTYDWDENNINVPCEGNPSILKTNSSATLLEQKTATTKKRIGVPVNSLGHTYNCNGLDDYTASSNLKKEGDRIDDIDDFNGNSSIVTIDTVADGVDYVEQDTVTINTNVFYMDDSANYSQSSFSFSPSFSSVTNTTNIKSIVVTLTSSNSAQELQKTIILKAFSCNLGSYHYYTGRVP